jgi:antirestriction protein
LSCPEIPKETPEIYLVCEASDAKSILHGTWVHVTQPLKDIGEQIEVMLAKSPVSGTGFMIKDYRGFGAFEIHKYENIEHLVRLKALLVSAYGELGTKLVAYYKDDLEEAIEALSSHYVGVYGSELEYAIALFDTHYLPAVSLKARPYIHYQQFRKDIFIRDCFSIKVENKTHVFVRH